jgi:hypothetical protein
MVKAAWQGNTHQEWLSTVEITLIPAANLSCHGDHLADVGGARAWLGTFSGSPTDKMQRH